MPISGWKGNNYSHLNLNSSPSQTSLSIYSTASHSPENNIYSHLTPNPQQSSGLPTIPPSNSLPPSLVENPENFSTTNDHPPTVSFSFQCTKMPNQQLTSSVVIPESVWNRYGGNITNTGLQDYVQREVSNTLQAALNLKDKIAEEAQKTTKNDVFKDLPLNSHFDTAIGFDITRDKDGKFHIDGSIVPDTNNTSSQSFNAVIAKDGRTVEHFKLEQQGSGYSVSNPLYGFSSSHSVTSVHAESAQQDEETKKLVAQIQKELETYQTSHQNLSEELKSLQDEHRTLREDYTKNKSTLESLEERLKKSDVNHSTLLGEIKTLKETIKQHAQRLNSLEENIKNLEGQLKTILAKIMDLESRVAELEKQGKDISDLKTQFDELKKQLTQAANERDALKAQIDKLKEINAELQEKMTAADDVPDQEKREPPSSSSPAAPIANDSSWWKQGQSLRGKTWEFIKQKIITETKSTSGIKLDDVKKLEPKQKKTDDKVNKSLTNLHAAPPSSQWEYKKDEKDNIHIAFLRLPFNKNDDQLIDQNYPQGQQIKHLSVAVYLKDNIYHMAICSDTQAGNPNWYHVASPISENDVKNMSINPKSMKK